MPQVKPQSNKLHEALGISEARLDELGHIAYSIYRRAPCRSYIIDAIEGRINSGEINQTEALLMAFRLGAMADAKRVSITL